MLALFIIVPLALTVVLNILPKKFVYPVIGAVVGTVALAQMIAVFMPVSQPCPFMQRFGELVCWDIAVDNLSLVMLLSIAVVTAVTIMAGAQLIKDKEQYFQFANLVLLTLTGMNGVVLVRDIFSLYVFMEITGVASFILIALQKDGDGLEGAFKYILFSAVATVFMLSAVGIFIMSAGGTSFAVIQAALQSSTGNVMTLLAIAAFMTGLFMKSGLMPFHGWLPDAYAGAPAPVSVMLAGIVTKVAGVYTLLRVVYSVIGFTPQVKMILMLLGVVSIILGALAALGQTNMKRLLAYSSISQVGYIVLSFGCGSALGFAGALFHIFNHALFKSLLFVNSAAVEKATGVKDMERMGGLGSKMPLTGVAASIGALSTAGIPPFSGFWSKLVIVIALWQAGYPVYAVIAVLASVITLAYMLMFQRKVFWGKTVEGFQQVREAGFGLMLPTIILTLAIIGIGLGFPLIMNTFMLPVERLW